LLDLRRAGKPAEPGSAVAVAVAVVVEAVAVEVVAATDSAFSSAI